VSGDASNYHYYTHADTVSTHSNHEASYSAYQQTQQHDEALGSVSSMTDGLIPQYDETAIGVFDEFLTLQQPSLQCPTDPSHESQTAVIYNQALTLNYKNATSLIQQDRSTEVGYNGLRTSEDWPTHPPTADLHPDLEDEDADAEWEEE